MRVLIAVCLCALLSANPAVADPIGGASSQSTGMLGDFVGDFNFSMVDANSGTITVQLTNTSQPINGGFITGFVFNNPGNAITSASLAGTNGSFQLLGGATYNNTVPGNPFGDFDIGAALGGNFLGGGNPNFGIGVGDTDTFVFSVSGTGVGSLTNANFFNELSDNSSQGHNDQFFLVRFRGFINGGSDKVPAGDPTQPPDPDDVPPPIDSVPEPASLLLWAILATVLAFMTLKARFRRAGLVG